MRKIFAGLLACLLCTSAIAATSYSIPSSVTALPRSQGVIGTLRGANMNATTDNIIPVTPGMAAFTVTGVTVTNCSASLTLAAGGVYTAASKGGTAIVAAGQLYSALTGATVALPLTLAVNARYTSAQANFYLSLTTTQGAAATCDVYILGVDLS